jgi:hypothetical protein
MEEATEFVEVDRSTSPDVVVTDCPTPVSAAHVNIITTGSSTAVSTTVNVPPVVPPTIN